MPAPTADDIREGVLRRMERQATIVRVTMLGAGAVEALMLGLALWLIDWQNRTHILMFVLGVLGYTILVLGLVALGAHVSRACKPGSFASRRALLPARYGERGATTV